MISRGHTYSTLSKYSPGDHTSPWHRPAKICCPCPSILQAHTIWAILLQNNMAMALENYTARVPLRGKVGCHRHCKQTSRKSSGQPTLAPKELYAHTTGWSLRCLHGHIAFSALHLNRVQAVSHALHARAGGEGTTFSPWPKRYAPGFIPKCLKCFYE